MDSSLDFWRLLHCRTRKNMMTARMTAPATLPPIIASRLMGLGSPEKETLLEEKGLAASDVGCSDTVSVPVLPTTESWIMSTDSAATEFALEIEKISLSIDRVEGGGAWKLDTGVLCVDVVDVV